MADRTKKPADRPERVITLISKAARAAGLVAVAIQEFLRIHW